MTAPPEDREFGPCTECGTPHDGCHGPDYCCAECLHLDASWDGYEQPTPTLSPEEAATVARFDEAEAAPESLTERVARVILDELDGGPFSDREWRDAFDEGVRDLYRAAADAAIRVVTEDAR